MSEEENILQPASESIPQLTEGLKSNKEGVRQLIWAFKEGMREFNRAVILAHSPVENPEDCTVDTNLKSDDPRSAQFLRSMTGSMGLLMDCDGELPRA